MKNKEVYKQAFKHVHYQKEINLNQRRIPKPLITLATSLIVLLSTFTVAYAFDVGGIQSKLDVWFHGEKRNVQYEKVGDDTYHLYTTDENGNVIDIGIDSGTKWTPTGMKPMAGDELVESLNDEFGIFYDEKEDKYLFYYQDIRSLIKIIELLKIILIIQINSFFLIQRILNALRLITLNVKNKKDVYSLPSFVGL